MVDPAIHPNGAAETARSIPHPVSRRRGNPGVPGAEDREIPVPDSIDPLASEPISSDAASDKPQFDQTGRPLGARALQTRQRILDATIAELAIKPMRDLRVIDIARRIGSSPATFYQYFKDIEDVVLQLCEDVTQAGPNVANVVINSGFEGAEGLELAKRLVERGIDHWDRNGPVLRVRNTAADEGDERFVDVRARALDPLIESITAQIAASHARTCEASDSASDASDSPGHIDPRAGAMAIFALIDRLSMYHGFMEANGISREEIVETGATIFQMVVTSRK
jgi:AcrR family transcriptional regulator